MVSLLLPLSYHLYEALSHSHDTGEQLASSLAERSLNDISRCARAAT